MSHGRWPDSVRQRVRQFFVDNPDEELTYEEMAAKFDTTINHCRELVKALKDEGLIESVHVIRNRSKGTAS